MRKWMWLGQWTAGLIVAIGIGVELGTGADIGYVIITAGSLVLFIATKLKRRM